MSQKLENSLSAPSVSNAAPERSSNGATGSSPSPRGKSPQRVSTDPVGTIPMKVHKRIVVCCDGTWKDGIIMKERWKYTNLIRLARAIKHIDARQPNQPPIHQVVFYQSGIGTDESLQSKLLEGATGLTLADKVQEAYAFIAHNYEPGDEIFRFGFSRGAYTARMVAQFIGQIGALDSKDMDHFAEIFVAFQQRGKTEDPEKIAALEKELEPWTKPDARGKQRMHFEDNPFPVKVVGVFDTVGSIGMPTSITSLNPMSDNMKRVFGFNDRKLGHYIEHAYHAMALNEKRADFDICKFEQTAHGRQKGQTLKQCWFAGAHSDVGGGYEEHDLADISLAWMAANIEDALLLDIDYLKTRPDPLAPYGQLVPHDSKTGIFWLGGSNQREIAKVTDDITRETVHPSVLRQATIQPDELKAIVKDNPDIVSKLLPLEEAFETVWPIQAAKAEARRRESVKPTAVARVKDLDAGKLERRPSAMARLRKISANTVARFTTTKAERGPSESSQAEENNDWDGTNVGAIIKELKR